MPIVHTEGLELHERMRPDKLLALKTAFDALQPLGLSGRPDMFVFRSGGGEADVRMVYLLQLSLVERDDLEARNPVVTFVSTACQLKLLVLL